MKNPCRRASPHKVAAIIGCLLGSALLSLAKPALASDSAVLYEAEALSAAGDVQGALALLEERGRNPSPPAEASDVEAGVLEADLLRRQGRWSRAESVLGEVQTMLDSLPQATPVLAVLVQQQRARLALQRGAYEEANAEISDALAQAREVPRELRASLVNDAAIIRQPRALPADTIAQFTAAAEIALGGADEAPYRVNAARAMLDDGRLADFEQAAERLSHSLASSPHPAAWRSQIALALLYRRAVNELAGDASLRLLAFELLRDAGGSGGLTLRDRSLIGGYVAELYADDRQYEAALDVARTALSAAAQAGAVDLEYRWEWIIARAHEAMGDSEAAIAAYDRAIASLELLRGSLDAFDLGTLNQVIKPMYYGYANLLLKQSLPLRAGADKQALLSRTRATLEGLKRAEVQDYFRAQCVAGAEVELDSMADRTAVLYPVLLEDRLELLLTTNKNIQQISVPVTRTRLVGIVREFRLNLEADTGSEDYLRLAQLLFTMLIEPLEPALAESRIDTLVFVPDGALRTIPLSALHDGQGYLIERFAIAIAPGLTLIDPKPFAGQSYSVLAGGISESVQGFPALPGVQRELRSLDDIMNARSFTNSAFTLGRVEAELSSGDYSVVHFATHGQFGGSYDDSFLLTYDDRLQINALSRNIQSRATNSASLELLVLSACETAAGDDRAALGLAGVALKAGARSALATLWEVDDQSAVDIVTEFYRALANGGASKARSLQRAQLKLVRSERGSHPSKWAPFLMIGNWL